MENYKKTSLMEWQAGKVKGFSGKDLISLENGGVKMVRVDPYAEYPVHLHPKKTEFVYVLEGMPTITINEEEYKGEKGDFFILPDSLRHSIANPTINECLLLVGAINK